MKKTVQLIGIVCALFSTQGFAAVFYIPVPISFVGGNDTISSSVLPHYGGDGVKISGYLVHADTSFSFFQNAIRQVAGENNSDVISFGSARIIDQKYSLIQFEVDEAFALQLLASGVNGKPDQLKRVYMVLATDQKNTPDLEQIRHQLESLDWEGYKVLEWVKNAVPNSSVIEAL